uniref:Uncharacterized protein n=1 Tax=Arundo donax TaxID=35708 RepID=A0A0A8Y267_ARUDO
MASYSVQSVLEDKKLLESHV